MASNQQRIFQPTGNLFGTGMDFNQHRNSVESANDTRQQRNEILALLEDTINQLDQKAEDTGKPLPLQVYLTPDQVDQILGGKVVSLSRTVTVSIQETLERRSLLQFALETRLHEILANRMLLLANSRIQHKCIVAKEFQETLNRLAIREMFMQ